MYCIIFASQTANHWLTELRDTFVALYANTASIYSSKNCTAVRLVRPLHIKVPDSFPVALFPLILVAPRESGSGAFAATLYISMSVRRLALRVVQNSVRDLSAMRGRGRI